MIADRYTRYVSLAGLCACYVGQTDMLHVQEHCCIYCHKVNIRKILLITEPNNRHFGNP